MIAMFKRLHPDAVLPEYKTPGASGFDLVAIEDVTVEPHEKAVVKTGLAVQLPSVPPIFYEMQVRPRSGMALKTPIEIPNSPGTVDIDYRGEIGVIVRNTGDWGSSYTIHKGDRIAQGVICPIVRCDIFWVEELSATERGAGGYGSTDKEKADVEAGDCYPGEGCVCGDE